MWTVYIADMRFLKTSLPEVWPSWMEILAYKSLKYLQQQLDGTMPREQQNKVIKNRGGITGITYNENSQTQHFLIAPVLSAIAEEMQQLGGVVQPSSKKTPPAQQ